MATTPSSREKNSRRFIGGGETGIFVTRDEARALEAGPSETSNGDEVRVQ